MKRLLVTAGLSTALVVAALSPTVSAAASGNQNFVLIEKNKEEQFNVVDNPPRSPHKHRLSPGDTATLRQPLHSESGARVGWVDVACTATRGGRFSKARFVCQGFYSLRDGALAVAVRFDPSHSPTIAITGGTGIYAGASGTITQVERRNGSKQTVHVLMP